MDLKIHDKLEMEVKRIMADGLDIDGEQEAQARDKLRGRQVRGPALYYELKRFSAIVSFVPLGIS